MTGLLKAFLEPSYAGKTCVGIYPVSVARRNKFYPVFPYIFQ